MSRAALAAVAVLVLAVAVERATDRWGSAYDLTAERSLSLTAATREVVEAVDRDVHVTAFLRRDQPGRTEAAAVLERYRRLNRRIRYRLVDPDAAPGEVRRLGVDPLFGGVAVRQGTDVELVPTATEADLTTALVRLERDVRATICVTTGHGELDVRSTLANGTARLAQAWREHGYVVSRLDLLAATPGRSGAPLRACDAAVVAFPTAPLGEAVVEAVGRYLAAGGRLLVLGDPDAELDDLDRLLAPYGLGFARGLVLERDPSAAFAGDVAAPIVSRYSSANPVVRNLPPTFFPATTAVTVDDDTDTPGLTLSRLADTSPDSVLEGDGRPPQPGPVTVAAAADLSRVEARRIVRTRVLAVGDADFATNALLDEAGNRRLLVQAADWLTLNENLVTVDANLARPRPLELTDARRTYALALAVLVVPGLFATGGGLVWALRRAR